MPCYSPVTGRRTPDGRVVFSGLEGYTDRPVTVACGRCVGCRAKRARDWAVRIVHEAKMHERNAFLTLTYDDEHLPNGESLSLRDWQLFAKRCYKRFGTFRYFHCGEYGEKLGRPHDHCIVFGEDFSSDRYPWTMRNGYPVWRSPTLEKLWPNGQSEIGSVTLESAAYVAGYVHKKVYGAKAEDHYTRVDPYTGECFSIRPEYTTMSRRPGIGRGWLDAFQEDVFPADFVVHEGKKVGTPRYYSDQLGDRDPEAREELRRERIRKATQWKESYERLKVREKVAEAKMMFAEEIRTR